MNIENVVESDLCTGCGACKSICPNSAIDIVLDKKKGIYIPVVDNKKCIDCGLCFSTCPGHSVDFKTLNNSVFKKEPENKMIGNYVNCYMAHSEDRDIRYNSSSGGLVTSLLIFALEEKLIDGALITRMDQKNPLEPVVLIATNKEEIISASGSKYCPVPANIGIKKILKKEGKYAVVGLPCHIHGIRKFENINPELKNRIKYHFGLFCANTSTMSGTKYFLNQKKIDKEKIKDINYRGEGWPGKISVTLDDGTKKSFLRSSKSAKNNRLKSSAFHYDFTPIRCLLCCDQTSELSDISFADPWLPELKDEKIGKSLIISRNKNGEELIEKAVKKNIISIEKLPIDDVLRAQNYSFKKRVYSRMYWLKRFGRPVPKYTSKPNKKRITEIIELYYYFPSFSYVKKYWHPLLKINAYIRSYVKKIDSYIFQYKK